MFLSMASQYRRRRGTPTVALNAFVAPDVKQRLDEVAAAAQMPLWAAIEAAVRAGVPDATGIPVGWQFPSADDEAKEPKTRAA